MTISFFQAIRALRVLPKRVDTDGVRVSRSPEQPAAEKYLYGLADARMRHVDDPALLFPK